MPRTRFSVERIFNTQGDPRVGLWLETAFEPPVGIDPRTGAERTPGGRCPLSRLRDLLRVQRDDGALGRVEPTVLTRGEGSTGCYQVAPTMNVSGQMPLSASGPL